MESYRINTILKLLILLFINVACADNVLVTDMNDVKTRAVNEEPKVFFTCAANSTATRSSDIEVQPLTTLPKTIYLFNVYIHIIRPAGGNEFKDKESICNTLMERLNRYFHKHSIYFSLSGSEFIDSDIYNAYNRYNATQIYSVNPHSDAFDIYIFTNGDNFGSVGGAAVTGQGNECWVTSNSYHLDTAPHEMGHILGLEHTFKGTADGMNPEFVDGSNAATAGDKIIDTPADPAIYDNNFNYGGTIHDVDAHGDVYRPDETNLMSYYAIRNQFTEGQEAKIRSTIYGSTEKKARLHKGNNLIQGNSIINSSAKYELNSSLLSEYLLDNASIRWTVKMDAYSNSLSKNVTSTTYYTSKTLTIKDAGSDYPSQKYTIKATITDSRGYSFTTEEKTAHFVRVNFSSGSLRWQTLYNNKSTNGTCTSISNYIRAYQGGVLYLDYIDNLGGSSTVYPSNYSFMILGNMASYFQMRSNKSFYCATGTPKGTTYAMLQITVSGLSNIISIPIEIMSPSSIYDIEADSIRLENDSISKIFIHSNK
ncbi:M43 family zinc metalloprotease [uncultured Bacteroides sp.]|uniref:M43 family zinc metalloprotease n=1 Tax=uncultured Bacteroides sp. TaxID=162156 RepID=UPI0025DE3251|nr:M43 family zinc metalloprotease [uncultured Bacteroides sp.]